MAINNVTYVGKDGDVGFTSGAARTSCMFIGNSTTAEASTSTSFKGVSLYFSSTAASGDIRGIYCKMSFDADGTGGGEALRAFTMVNKNIGTAHGAHLSLGFVATAGVSECSGLGVAARCTLHIPDIASWAPTGTYSAVQAEIYSDGSASDPANMTELSFIRVIAGGTQAGIDNVDDDARFMSIQGLTAGAAHVFATGLTANTVNAATTASLKCKVGSTTYYIPLATAIT